MGLTNFPNGIFATPNIGGGNDYAGWWLGKKSWYVDDDRGSDGNVGNTPQKALKTIQKAINLSGAGDTIYLKPREVPTGTYSAHGYYTGTNIIANNQQGLAIIGTGRGGRGWGSNVQCAIEPDSASTDVTILVQSPCVSIENVMIKCVTSAAGAISANSNTNEAWGLTVSNCTFKDFKAVGQAVGTIDLHTIHWSTIQHCTFRESGVAINLASTYAITRGNVVRDCTFMGVVGEWSNDIRIGDCKSLEIDNCRFLHAVPTGGAPNKYIVPVGTTASGLVSNCYFGVDTVTIGDVLTIVDALSHAHCFGEGLTAMS